MKLLTESTSVISVMFRRQKGTSQTPSAHVSWCQWGCHIGNERNSCRINVKFSFCFQDGSTALNIAMDAGRNDIAILLYAQVNFRSTTVSICDRKLVSNRKISNSLTYLLHGVTITKLFSIPTAVVSLQAYPKMC